MTLTELKELRIMAKKHRLKTEYSRLTDISPFEYELHFTPEIKFRNAKKADRFLDQVIKDNGLKETDHYRVIFGWEF